ncbi:MAG: rod shape-determining protein MreD [Actinobacteria bacterium]|nr:rod shape-determining protein MreD [Actinomycetota bacterium]
MRARTGLTVFLMVLTAVVVQTTLINQLQFVIPDLVLLLVILLALTRLRPEAVLGVAFFSGLLIDLLGTSLLGLRAIVLTMVAYAAIRTRERAEIGRVGVALWVGLLTFGGIVILALVGTLFGQGTLLGSDAVSRMFLVPIANTILAALTAGLFVRLVDRDASAFRFT